MSRILDPGTISNFLLLRVSALPPAILDQLTLPRTTEAVMQLQACQQEQDSLAQAAAEHLYAVVPQLAGNVAARRAALAWKRAIHNGRAPKLRDEDRSAILAQMEPAHQTALLKWEDAVERVGQANQALEEVLASEQRVVRERLQSLLNDPALLQGVALASPSFVEQLGRTTADDLTSRSSVAKTAVAYLARAAVKTSPFSTFTHLALYHNGQPVDPVPGGRYLTLARSVATSCLLAFGSCPQSFGEAVYQVNETLTCQGGRWSALVGRYTYYDSFAWRIDQPVDLSQLNPWLGSLNPGQVYLGKELLAVLPAKVLQVMLRVGVLQPLPPDGEAPPVVSFRQQIEGLNAAAEAVGSMNGLERVAQVRCISAETAAVLTQYGAQVPNWVSNNTLVLEDVAVASPAPLPSEFARADLEQLGELVRPNLVCSYQYDVIQDWFVEMHGSGGVCTDVMAFCRSFAENPTPRRRLQETLRAEQELVLCPTPERAMRPVSPTSSPPAVVIFAQVDAASPEAVCQGDFRLVINQIGTGLGGVLTRFSHLFGRSGESLAWLIGEWLGRAFPQSEPVPMTVSSDWNNAQWHLPLTPRYLRWPLDLRLDGRALTANALSLKHDAETGALLFLGPEGRLVSPAYMGTVPTHLFQGALRTLTTLMQPYFLAGPLGSARSLFQPAPPTDVVHTPRMTIGRIVLNRATWRLPTESFPLRVKGETDSNYLVRVTLWRQANRIPEEVFLAGEFDTIPMEPRLRKPLWVHFTSLYALEAARPLILAGAKTLRLTEVLPRRDSHPFRGSDGQTRAGEIVLLMQWPRPGQQSGERR